MKATSEPKYATTHKLRIFCKDNALPTLQLDSSEVMRADGLTHTTPLQGLSLPPWVWQQQAYAPKEGPQGNNKTCTASRAL